MALKAVVYPQTQEPSSFGYGLNYNNFRNWTTYHHHHEDPSSYYAPEIWNNNHNTCSSPPELNTDLSHHHDENLCCSRPKRRRAKSKKNKEQIENQRMTHIAVERNRRKQMNHYLSVLRSLMPDSYVQRGDQASIIGGAINFVKELEQKLQFLGATHHHQDGDEHNNTPFSEFFTFPQYTTTKSTSSNNSNNNNNGGEGRCDKSSPSSSSTTVVESGGADIEVTMVESHANVKIRSKKKPKQLLKMVSALHTMSLTILHLNVTTTINHFVLYSLSLKVEDDCKLGSVDDIAAAVYQLMNSIQQEAPTIFN